MIYTKDDANAIRGCAKACNLDSMLSPYAVGHVWHVAGDIFATDGKRFHLYRTETVADAPVGYEARAAARATAGEWRPSCPWLGTTAYTAYHAGMVRIVADIESAKRCPYATFKARRDVLTAAFKAAKALLAEGRIACKLAGAANGAKVGVFAFDDAEPPVYVSPTQAADVDFACHFQPRFMLDALAFVGGKVVTLKIPTNGTDPASLVSEDGKRIACVMPVSVRK